MPVVIRFILTNNNNINVTVYNKIIMNPINKEYQSIKKGKQKHQAEFQKTVFRNDFNDRWKPELARALNSNPFLVNSFHTLGPLHNM